MDLQLYMRVLWRFRLLVGAGLLLATGLALLSFASVGPGGFSYREQELWANLSQEKDRYFAAAEKRDFDTAVIFAGEAVDLVDSVLPAREIVKRICG